MIPYAVLLDADGLVLSAGYVRLSAGPTESLVYPGAPVAVCPRADWSTDKVSRWTGDDFDLIDRLGAGLERPAEPWRAALDEVLAGKGGRANHAERDYDVDALARALGVEP